LQPKENFLSNPKIKKEMNSYNDIQIGFINEDNFTRIKERKTNDNIILYKLHKLFHDHCLVQYHYNTSFDYHIVKEPVPCRFCQEIFPNNTLIHYHGHTRFIFPNYLYHYIKHHNIEIDPQLLELVNE